MIPIVLDPIKVSNSLGTVINPATEDSLSQLALTITNAIDQTAYNLLSAAFSATTAITNDYILDNIEFNFTTAESKTITVTTADGTVLFQDTNTNTHVVLSEIEQAFNGGENITVAVTQTAGACSMDCVVKIKQGSNTLVGNPTVDQGTGGSSAWNVIDIAHIKVHEGRYFSGGYYNASVAGGGAIDLLIQSSATEDTHVRFHLMTGGDATSQLYEGTTFSAAGTAVTISNHNRQSAKVFSGTVTHTPTVTDVGSQLNGTQFVPGGGGGNAVGGEMPGFLNEFILAASTTYLLRVTNITGNNQAMAVHFECYQPTL